MPEPSPEEAREFRAIYKPAYRANWRATPGAVETLVRLRQHSYRLAIVSNGQIADQEAKTEAIEICHLIDCIFTSEEAGCSKPDRGIFQFAIETLGAGASPNMTHMVGESADSDIKAAFNAGLNAILYLPIAKESQCLPFSREVPVITHINQILEHLSINNPGPDSSPISSSGQTS